MEKSGKEEKVHLFIKSLQFVNFSVNIYKITKKLFKICKMGLCVYYDNEFIPRTLKHLKDFNRY